MFGSWPTADDGSTRLKNRDGLHDLTREIEFALEKNLLYLGVLSCMSLPDICGALEDHRGEATKSAYMAWWNEWMAHQFSAPGGFTFTGLDAYSLRCAMFHQGALKHSKLAYTRILFNYTVMNIHNCPSGDPARPALILDPKQFGRQILDAVAKWWEAKKDTPNVVTNWPKLMKLYPNGISPYAGSAVLG